MVIGSECLGLPDLDRVSNRELAAGTNSGECHGS